MIILYVLFMALLASNFLRVYITLSETRNTTLDVTVSVLESLALGIAFYLAI